MSRPSSWAQLRLAPAAPRRPCAHSHAGHRGRSAGATARRRALRSNVPTTASRGGSTFRSLLRLTTSTAISQCIPAGYPDVQPREGGGVGGRRSARATVTVMVAEPADVPSALAVRGLRVVLPDGRVLIDGVDLAIGAGEVVALLGGAGAGKSTFARVLFARDELDA